MFFPIHVATGAVIDKASGKGRWRKWLLVAPLAFMSHALLDYFNGGESGSLHILYHGPLDGTLNSVVIFLSVILGLTLAFLARQYLVGIVFACLPDVEHGFFLFTGIDASQGLHAKLFWLPVLSSEWGLLIQLGLYALVAAIVLLPREGFSWRWTWPDPRARIRFPSLSLQKVSEYSVQGWRCPLREQARGTEGRLVEEVCGQAVPQAGSRGIVTAVVDEQTARACGLHAAPEELPIVSQSAWGERQPSEKAQGDEFSARQDSGSLVEDNRGGCVSCLPHPQLMDGSPS
jgi:hypothetical protein